MRPIAPAASACCAFTTNVHDPRSTRAMRPATSDAFVYAVQPSVVAGPSTFAASSAATIAPLIGRVSGSGPNVAVFTSKLRARADGAVTTSVVADARNSLVRARVNGPSHTTLPLLRADALRCAA